jgi:phosphonate transport system ATP-binding protein
VVTAVLAGRLPAMGLLRSLRALFYPDDIGAAFAALERFDLGDKLFERVDRLSGGERQRVGLARALLAPAGLWLVDEPLSALDPTRSRQAIATLVEEAGRRSVTLLATLHQVEVALANFPRIIGLRDGELAFDLPSSEVGRARLERLYAQHEHELDGAVPELTADAPVAAAPATMYCR